MDGWSTFPIQLGGGLRTDVADLQQGSNFPGTARLLNNFEPSIEGGYKRVLGYTKFSEDYVPPYGDPVVQGSGQSGTTLEIANLMVSPSDGDTFTIAGVTGTYTIASSGVSYSTTNKTATLTLVETLSSSPADKADITFNNVTDLVSGTIYYDDTGIAARNNDIWSASINGSWTKISVPDYGTVLVNGGSQTGTSLIVDGIASDTYVPQAGDTFTVAGIEKVYTVLAEPTVSSGGTTLSIAPALASSPADNAAITFLSTDTGNGSKCRFEIVNYDGTDTLVIVNSADVPMYYDGTTFSVFQDAPTEINSAQYVADFSSHLCFAKGRFLSILAPLSLTNANVSAGAAVLELSSNITGILPFRDQLIVFCLDRIYRLVGNTVSSFQLLDVTKNLGCPYPDTIQEFGGDVMFMSRDGIRMLGASDRIGDLSLAAISRSVQSEFNTFISSYSSFASCTIPSKSQYRVFGYNPNISSSSTRGFIVTQFSMQGPESIQQSEITGFKPYVCTMEKDNTGDEFILFANASGFVYLMERENTFDGAAINYTYASPYLPLNDPTVRKSYYKLDVYTDTIGTVDFNVALNFDFNNDGVIQPASINLTNTTGSVSVYGNATYGTATYGGKLLRIFSTPVIGSSFSVSVVITGSAITPPFALDTLVLQYSLHDRR